MAKKAKFLFDFFFGGCKVETKNTCHRLVDYHKEQIAKEKGIPADDISISRREYN